MALKAVIDSLDQVAEAFRPEYTSKDGKFVLAIEGAPAGFVPASELATANGKLTEFRDNNIALLKEVDTLKPVKTEFEAFKVKYDGIDPAEVVTLKAKVAEFEKKGVKDPNDIAAQIVMNEISGMPVTEKTGEIVGVITEADILGALMDGKKLENLTAQDIMSADPITVDLDTPVNEVMKRIEENGVLRLPVISHGKVVGIMVRSYF